MEIKFFPTSKRTNITNAEKLTEALNEDSIIKAFCNCIMDDLPATVVDVVLLVNP